MLSWFPVQNLTKVDILQTRSVEVGVFPIEPDPDPSHVIRFVLKIARSDDAGSGNTGGIVAKQNDVSGSSVFHHMTEIADPWGGRFFANPN